MRSAVRLEATTDIADVQPADLYGIASDLRNLPSWWIEHLSAEVTERAARSRDSIYRVRYRLPGGVVITATCGIVATRQGQQLTYVWEGGGVRMAIGQAFVPYGTGSRIRLIADVALGRRLRLLGPVLTPLMRRNLTAEMERANITLAELAAARAVVRRASLERRTAPRTWEEGGAPLRREGPGEAVV